MNSSQFCIECGRELHEYISQTLHVCNLCETEQNELFRMEKK